MDLYFSKNNSLRFRFPVTPRAVNISIKGRDTTAAMIDGSEISILNGPGLREIEFEALLPNKRYHFAVYENDTFAPARYFLDLLEQLKNEREAFWLVLGSGETGISIKTAITDYSVTEDAALGGDVKVFIRLREFRDAALKATVSQSPVVSEPVRDTSSAPPAPKTYTVVKGDTLWAIAKKLLGSGARYTEIFNLNRDKLANPNMIHAGQVLLLP